MTLSTVTIMLCTCERPEMLREALKTVREQTARAAISKIVVSENSLSGDSESICTEFTDLPIVYVQQRPPVIPLLHPKAIWHLIDTPLLAILHDDDWWAPRHLESALDVLKSNEHCPAVYSSFFEAFRPGGYTWLSQVYYFAWIAAGADFSRSVLFYDPSSVMLGCIINAGFHYSTVVGRAKAMWDAYSNNISWGNTFDNDRTFPVFLSQHGLLGYVTTPDVYVRQHPFRDAWSEEHLKHGHMKMARETTRRLLNAFPQEVSLAAAKFKQVCDNLDPREAGKVWPIIRDGIHEPQLSTLARECGINLADINRHPEEALFPKWFHSIVQSLAPPIFLRWAMRRRVTGWENTILRWQKKSNRSSPRY
jgi:hypothetical protein